MLFRSTTPPDDGGTGPDSRPEGTGDTDDGTCENAGAGNASGTSGSPDPGRTGEATCDDGTGISLPDTGDAGRNGPEPTARGNGVICPTDPARRPDGRPPAAPPAPGGIIGGIIGIPPTGGDTNDDPGDATGDTDPDGPNRAPEPVRLSGTGLPTVPGGCGNDDVVGVLG